MGKGRRICEIVDRFDVDATGRGGGAKNKSTDSAEAVDPNGDISHVSALPLLRRRPVSEVDVTSSVVLRPHDAAPGVIPGNRRWGGATAGRRRHRESGGAVCDGGGSFYRWVADCAFCR